MNQETTKGRCLVLNRLKKINLGIIILVKTKESLKRNIEPGVITERIKEIKNTYDKRIVLFNGETKPIEI
jgi:hypothetical protein